MENVKHDKMQFAKLYETEKTQILVVLDEDESGKPSIKFSWTPFNLGLCAISIKFEDNASGWDKADKCLSEMTQSQAVDVINSAEKSLRGE